MAVTMTKRTGGKEGTVGTFSPETTYEGCVLETREENGYDDSDFYAIVWSEATQSVTRVTYATTRAWTYDNGATVDATDEVREKARLFHAQARYDRMKAADEKNARAFAPGKKVAVNRPYKSRKLGRDLHDEIGTCVYYGRGFGQPYAEKYGRTPPMRVGVEFADGKVYFDDNDVEVIEHEKYLSPDADLRTRANTVGPNESFAWMFSRYSVIL